MKTLILVAMAMTSINAFASEGGFLFSTMRDEETPMAEQIYFGISEDGRHWEALNGGKPVLVSDVGEKGVRDSFLLRSHDGKKVWLIATDLCIHRNRDWHRATHVGSQSLVVWESEDLVHWSSPWLARVAPDDAGCAWAPAAIYDEETGNYLVCWASTTGRDRFAKQRIWAARTKDFRTFDPPFIFDEKPNHVIDIEIVRDGDTYYRFTKDDRHKAISMETSQKLLGPWQALPQFTSEQGKNAEGPICYRLPTAAGQPPVWCLLLDNVIDRIGAGADRRRYEPFITHDLSTGQFTPATDFRFPYPFRHGSVLPLTAAERERLKLAYSELPKAGRYTPPMGWNSYDAFGTSVTETEVLANAEFMQKHLRPHGWEYVVIDARWYDSIASCDDRDFNRERIGAKLFADEFGRMLPATNRFPSGFTKLAEQLHARGLKFGFHMMRGIPRQAVNIGTRIEGSRFTAADAGDTKDICSWCPDMFGVRNNEAGQAWYDACARLWASWGLDFVKVDDLSSPYHAPEIEMIRKALDKCGRPTVFSTSAGPTDPEMAAHIAKNANLWRISGDFWDRWKDLDHAFGLLAHWQGVGGLGHWPDLDMIPFGHLGIKCTIAGGDRQSRFTKDEQITLMTLWALAPSPLMLGAHLPDLDAKTLALLTNDEVLSVNQDPLGKPATRESKKDGVEIWRKQLADGSTAIGYFNRSDKPRGVTLPAGRDLWHRQDMAETEDVLQPHASRLLKVQEE